MDNVTMYGLNHWRGRLDLCGTVVNVPHNKKVSGSNPGQDVL